jgi:arginine exporter protein ArgO
MNSTHFPLTEGFFLTTGLITGIGRQCALILRQGLRRQHLLLIVLI